MGETTGKDGRMSITDELREYAQSWRETPNLMDELDAGDIDGLLGDFEHIADHIDAEHERVLRETGEEIVADVRREWMPLPVDADGAPVRIGDVMEWVDGETFEVVGIGDGVLYYLEGDGDALADWTLAENKRHHHAPTVEDVLREFALACEDAGNAGPEVARDAGNAGPEVARIAAEYAKRLTLAEGEDA